MTVWMVRAGETGQRADLAFAHKVTTLNWWEVGNISDAPSREELKKRLHEGRKRGGASTIGDATAANWAGQLWAFVHDMAVGDLIVMSLRSGEAYAIGRVTGPYAYRADLDENARHTRAVDWVQEGILRAELGEDLRRTLGGQLAVFRPAKYAAQERLEALAAGRPDPGI